MFLDESKPTKSVELLFTQKFNYGPPLARRPMTRRKTQMQSKKRVLLKNKFSKNKQARRDYLPPALAAMRDTAQKAGVPLNSQVLKVTGAVIEKPTSIPNEPDQTKYERDTLIWMLIDITGKPKVDLFAEAIAEIKKLKEIREGATHWAGNAVHFQQEANTLREQLAGKKRVIEGQRKIIRKLRSQEWQARKLARELADPDPCRLDHHGYCQAHGWMSADECPHGKARKLLGYK